MQIINTLIIITSILIATTSCGRKEVAIMSFNIRMNAVSDTGDISWDNRKNAVIKMIEEEKPAVIGMQEVLYNQLTFLEDNLHDYSRIGVGRDDGEDGGEFMAVFYDKDLLKIESQGNFWLSETPSTPSRGWDAACNRMVTWAEFSYIGTNRSFYFFNTHLDHVGKEARKQSIALITDSIEQICVKDKPIFLTGDFNSTTDDVIFSPLLNMMQSAQATSLSTDYEGTFNGFKNKDTDRIIDYIFYKGSTAKEYRTIKKEYGVPYISDHYPIVCRFTI